MGKRPHVLAIAYLAQGHVGPLMKLSQLLADQGIRVTFVNTKSIHDRVLAALSEEDGCGGEKLMETVSIADGLEPDDHKDSIKIKESMSRFVPKELENLIRKINSSATEDEKIKCVIADATVP
ncbi:hypothetical protein FNV43_RR20858 [Rhamnella rubrinervis]|uniref:Uncharacterized protein n=1 Tax=Rhamnella rubrinervis TaxID=2594499 RepID=A0A8K0GQV7_9ROSA|nr:hypothetical protein FNV43_RR20858 [Rhamnella rubrinervis]